MRTAFEASYALHFPALHGFVYHSGVKAALLRIAKREGRSMAQICELLLKG